MRALGLLSGGLDSSLAVKMMQDQGIEVIALKFTSPFCRCDSGGKCHAADVAKECGIELMTASKGEEYLEIVRNPRFGRGSGMNPCIDCRIYMLKKAKEIAAKIGASFIFTGEVLGQRPMSQKRDTLMLIEREAGLEGRLLRPLSAKLLPPTEAELRGWVDRDRLLDICGRSRKRQLGIAKEKDIVGYACPAGGCLLTSKEFAAKLRDFLERTPDPFTMKDAVLLQIGRHLRIDGKRLIIGRNEAENKRLESFHDDRHWLLEPVEVMGPVGLIEHGDEDVLRKAASVVARYSDRADFPVTIRFHRSHEQKEIIADRADESLIAKYRISG